MDRTRYARQGETLIEWGASALLAAAIGWAAATIGQSVIVGIAIMALMLPAGVFMLRKVGAPANIGQALPEFAPEPIESAVDDELLLDDPILAVAPDSRVASLFDTAAPTPGAMVTRIADYLGDRPRQSPHALVEDEDRGADDAGAALNRALANIRASLR